MTITYNKIRTRIHLDRITANYRLLCKIGGAVIPVIKADAYGHGLVQVARVLAQAGAETFAVGTVEEGVKLRLSGCSGRIVSLLGPLDGEEYDALFDQNIIPFVGGFAQLEEIHRRSEQWGRPLPVSLKFDTGMARLGFVRDDLGALLERLKALPGVKPVMASSHLATADDPEGGDFVREQGGIFDEALAALAEAGFKVEANLANSAGILAHKDLHHQSQRAGIALYGCNPFLGTDLAELGRGLKPAMEVRTPVVAVHPLKKGVSISYGRTFKAPTDMTVAIVAVGYADAYSRGLSNKGAMLVHGRRAPILGRVCMQLTAVDVTGLPEVKPGDLVHLLGGEGETITPEELAGWWGTITYEVFCLLGLNRREYV